MAQKKKTSPAQPKPLSGVDLLKSYLQGNKTDGRVLHLREQDAEHFLRTFLEVAGACDDGEVYVPMFMDIIFGLKQYSVTFQTTIKHRGDVRISATSKADAGRRLEQLFAQGGLTQASPAVDFRSCADDDAVALESPIALSVEEVDS